MFQEGPSDAGWCVFSWLIGKRISGNFILLDCGLSKQKWRVKQSDIANQCSLYMQVNSCIKLDSQIILFVVFC